VSRGDWIQTAYGRQFWPIAPEPGDVHLDDIAHALSMLCRFGGHCLRFYSVAEHSVLLASAVAPQYRLWALLHDASEAYLVDVPRPLKPFLGGYREAEEKILAVVAERFGLSPEMPGPVKEADRAILMDEAAQNMAPPPAEWSTRLAPLGVTLQYWSPAQAKAEFLNRAEVLMSQGASR
jgi:hypothetical protein